MAAHTQGTPVQLVFCIVNTGPRLGDDDAKSRALVWQCYEILMAWRATFAKIFRYQDQLQTSRDFRPTALSPNSLGKLCVCSFATRKGDASQLQCSTNNDDTDTKHLLCSFGGL